MERREKLAGILKVLGEETEIENIERINYHDPEDLSEDYPARIAEWKGDVGRWVVFCKVSSVRWGEYGGFNKRAEQEVGNLLSGPAEKLGVNLEDFDLERTNIKTLLEGCAKKIGEEIMERGRVEYWVTPHNKRVKFKHPCY